MGEKTVIVTSDPELNLRYKLAEEIRQVAAEIDDKYGWRHAQGAYMAADAIDPDYGHWDS